MKPEEANAIFSTETFKDAVIPFNEGYFNDGSVDVGSSIDELEQDSSGENNGFN
jgi:hypothetical protein